MSNSRFIIPAFFFACVLGTGAESSGTSLSSQEKNKGYALLFNGRDLTGWKEVQGNPGSFEVENGEILGRRDRQKGTAYWLSTAEKYGDFELRLQVMLQPGGNSGVFIRVPSYKGRTSKAGMEIQLLDDGSRKGKPGKGNTGAIYSVAAPTDYVARPAGQWNDVAIRCEGDRIRITINGKLINDADMSKHDALKERPRKGYIGLSAHTKIVRFRNLRLLDLSKHPSTAEK